MKTLFTDRLLRKLAAREREINQGKCIRVKKVATLESEIKKYRKRKRIAAA